MQKSEQDKCENNFQIFKLKYDKSRSIYILLDNSFVNKLIQLHIGNKVENQQKKYTWYLQPEEALYLVSVDDSVDQYDQYTRMSYIQRIYMNCSSKEIDIMHFYLNLRKRNKFCKRINWSYFKFQSETTQQDLIKLNYFPFFKIYQSKQDWRDQKSQKYLLLAQTQQTISHVLFSPQIHKIKIQLQIKRFSLCIFQNNDFMISEVFDD